MSQASEHDKAAEGEKCECGSVHTPDQRKKALALISEANKVVETYVNNHGTSDPAISMPAMVEALAGGEATPLQQKAAVVLLVSSVMALGKLPKDIQSLLTDPRVEVAGATTINLGEKGKADGMPDFKVPGLAELLPKKAGKREDN